MNTLSNTLTPQRIVPRKPSGFVSGCVLGAAGVGKTSLIKDLEAPLFVDLERGDLALGDFECDVFQASNWDDLKDLACIVGGPDKNRNGQDDYSPIHYSRVKNIDLSKYKTIFIDSLTVASYLCLENAEKLDAKDDRLHYKYHAKEMLHWFSQLRRSKNHAVWLTGHINEARKLVVDGQKMTDIIPMVFDEIITMYNDTNGKVFLCNPRKSLGFPAKDRSGTLNDTEPANLQQLINKVTRSK